MNFPYSPFSSSRHSTIWAVISFSALASMTLSAADITWSATDGVFADSGNWAGGVVPGAADNAILNNAGTLRLSSTQTINGLQITSGTMIHTAGGGGLTVNTGFRIGAITGDTGVGDAVYQLDNAIITAGTGLSISSKDYLAKLDLVNGMITIPAGQALIIGGASGETGEAVEQGGFLNGLGGLKIGTEGSTGSYHLGSLNSTSGAAMVVGDDVVIGASGGSGSFLMDSGSFTKNINQFPNSTISLGVGVGSTGEVIQNGGVFVNNNSATRMGVGGDATWTVNGGQVVFGELVLGYSGASNATFTLNNSTMTTTGIHRDSTGDAILNLNGGTLMAGADSLSFLTGLDQATIAGAVTINTQTYNVDIAQNLLDDNGSISKTGSGTLTLTGESSLSAGVSVDEGSLIFNGTLVTPELHVSSVGLLQGNGTIDGNLNVEGFVGPGQSVGTMQVTGNAVISGDLEIDINGSQSNLLVVDGNLDISQTTLDAMVITGTADAPAYVIATYGSLTGGHFVDLLRIPEGYTVDYAYEGNQIALVVAGEETPFESWAAGYSLEGADSAADADPDHDGVMNGVEFLLGTDPTAPTSNEEMPQLTLGDESLTYIFKRSAQATSVEPTVEVSEDLQTWTTIEDDTNGASIEVDTDSSTGDETWTVTIPMAGTKQFVRLRADVP
ncbi:hypothetical protein JIN85_16830 [Luteolibacter pohnpeiensis]|uniref:ESPR domain-containing protein n=1 Tax=Luteolibacter pohnpeiensis TaxID=454153 RepID=A0A934S8G8_9BACT|nr:hypothetical protein [Luteolibacter pohnpeiensis]MBK1884087.1 hypothetical protein [Luteolibacter pohnpeiensis]